jgi:hypothetical protein
MHNGGSVRLHGAWALAAALVFTLLVCRPPLPAQAAPGDLVGTVVFNVDCCSGLGVGIAYDGVNLWYSCYDCPLDLHRADPITGVVTASYDIVPNGGLGALAYDATRNVIWAGAGGGGPSGNGGEVWRIQLDAGMNVVGAVVAFNVAPVVGACPLDDGLAFDARNVGNPNDDRIYYSNDCGTVTIRSFTLGGALDETFGWGGAGCYNSGLAIGGQLLYQGSDGCSHVWVVDKTTKAPSYNFTTVVGSDPNFRDEDLECDPNTFAGLGKQVMWSKEAYSPMRAHAFEIECGTCGFGGRSPCPQDITVCNDPGRCGAVVTFDCFAGICPGSTCSCDPPPGSFFPVGTTPVTCTATTPTGITTSCTFNVTVRDCEPPVIRCRNLQVCVDPGKCFATVKPEAGCRDNCHCTVSGVRDDGLALNDPYPIGVTIITWTACDGAGNCSQCQQKVIVKPVGVFDPPLFHGGIIGPWSPNGFTLRNGYVADIRFHLEDCDGHIICCKDADVVVKVKGPNSAGKMVTRVFSLKNGGLQFRCCPCCYEVVFNTRTYPVMSGGAYTIGIYVNGVLVGSMPFAVW